MKNIYLFCFLLTSKIIYSQNLDIDLLEHEFFYKNEKNVDRIEFIVSFTNNSNNTLNLRPINWLKDIKNADKLHFSRTACATFDYNEIYLYNFLGDSVRFDVNIIGCVKCDKLRVKKIKIKPKDSFYMKYTSLSIDKISDSELFKFYLEKFDFRKINSASIKINEHFNGRQYYLYKKVILK